MSARQAGAEIEIRTGDVIHVTGLKRPGIYQLTGPVIQARGSGARSGASIVDG